MKVMLKKLFLKNSVIRPLSRSFLSSRSLIPRGGLYLKGGMKMDYRININTDNDAFFSRPEKEAARILRRLADDIETMGFCNYVLRDHNGNPVSEASETDICPICGDEKLIDDLHRNCGK